jgi:membrane protein implicated in regulation of membrane protease activity
VHWIEKLSKAQRVVIVVALGAAFLAIGSFILSLGQRGLAFGWTGYAPFNEPAGWPAWLQLIVWLALTCLWAVVSIRVLRPSSQADSQ